MATANNKSNKFYDGTTDVEAFITRVNLKAAIKGYENAKKAQYIASLLAEGHALNIYLSLSDAEKIDCTAIETALRREFDISHRNREAAVEELSRRRPEKGELPSTFAYRLLELAKLAYVGLPDLSQKAIAKDYFVGAQSKEMQLALKSQATYGTKTISQLADDVTRLQTAGVATGSTQVKVESDILSVAKRPEELVNDDLVDQIAEKVAQKLSCSNHTKTADDEAVNYVSHGSFNPFNPFNPKGRGKGRSSNRGRGNRRGKFACRNCQSPNHGYVKCPTRFCQACGGRGHDAWSQECPNFK